ncbi:MAG: tRNA (adenosine(37)-N6)-dimethylallyltransferase MiaA [Candidatus Zambryskibacteria bacterium]|nr:tRNA (adenosine(37)-N6)-dimethylallyltransferase MiaA [Candidatus Zambryskibacteria bacterium]
MAQQKILVIVGPTASGKSSLAVRLAKKFNGEIISADSRQVYKGLDIGTGKITKQEMRGVPHHLLNVANPKKQFSVSEYKTLAENNLRYIVSCGKLPIVVGGTGFYIDTLTGRINFPNVPPDKKLREKLSQKSIETLFEMLMKKDPTRAKTIDKYNKVRLIRALEIIKKIGSIPPLGSSTSKSRYRFIFIGLKPDDLDKRIYKRLLIRFNGIIREGKKLHKQGLSYKRMYELGLEYRYIGMYLQNKISKKETMDKLYLAIKHYAKRQMTWFKRNKEIRWFTMSSVEGFKPETYKEIEKYTGRMLG